MRKIFGIVDVRLNTDDNEQLNVGIQIIDGVYIETKMLMYFAQIHLNQLEYSDNREFARTITINILDFDYYETDECIKKIKILTNEKYVKEELEFYVIELPKLGDIKNLNRAEQWITYFKGTENEVIEQIKNENNNIKLLDELCNKYWLDEKIE